MATSSIFTSIKLTDPAQIEKFINGLEESEHDPLPRATVTHQITDKEEVRKFMASSRFLRNE